MSALLCVWAIIAMLPEVQAHESPPGLSALPLMGAFPLTAEVVVAICDITSRTSCDQERAVILSLPRQKREK